MSTRRGRADAVLYVRCHGSQRDAWMRAADADRRSLAAWVAIALDRAAQADATGSTDGQGDKET